MHIIVVLCHGCISLALGKPLAFRVGVVPEVEEEDEEDEAVESNDVDEYGILERTVFHEEVLANMTGYNDKLD